MKDYLGQELKIGNRIIYPLNRGNKFSGDGSLTNNGSIVTGFKSMKSGDFVLYKDFEIYENEFGIQEVEFSAVYKIRSDKVLNIQLNIDKILNG